MVDRPHQSSRRLPLPVCTVDDLCSHQICRNIDRSSVGKTRRWCQNGCRNCLQYLMQYMHVLSVLVSLGYGDILACPVFRSQHACVRHTAGSSVELDVPPLLSRHLMRERPCHGRHGRGRRSHACLRLPLTITSMACHLLSSHTVCMVELHVRPFRNSLSLSLSLSLITSIDRRCLMFLIME
jgi:hypothetical protein